MEYIDDKAYVCGLFINSKEYSSEEFAHIIDDLGVKGISHICFVIGGSLGISDEIEKRCNMKISFSPMTESGLLFVATYASQSPLKYSL